MGRSPRCDKSKVKRGTWSPQEDDTLRDYLYKHGSADLQRCGKSCRLRWLNYLRPDIKHGPFSQEEDGVIFNLYTAIRSRWSFIASHLPGRTDNDVKNHWHSKLKKKLITAAAAASSTTTNASTTQPVSTPTFSLPSILSNNDSGLGNANDGSVHSCEPLNFTMPKFILEGSSNYSSANNSCPFSPADQVDSEIWSQEEVFGADNNAYLFSIFKFDSKPHVHSQSHY